MVVGLPCLCPPGPLHVALPQVTLLSLAVPDNQVCSAVARQNHRGGFLFLFFLNRTAFWAPL